LIAEEEGEIQMGQFRVVGAVVQMEVVQPVVVEHRSTPRERERISSWVMGKQLSLDKEWKL
jgi:hypothetical protein